MIDLAIYQPSAAYAQRAFDGDVAASAAAVSSMPSSLVQDRYQPAYDGAVAELDGLEPLVRDPRDTHALHLYVLRVDPERAGASRDEYQQALADEQIGTSIHFLAVHRLTYYRERYPDQPRLPVAERAAGEVLSLPLSPAHSAGDIEDAIDALRRVHGRFTA